MKIRSAGLELLYTNRQTDRQTEKYGEISRRIFCNCHEHPEDKEGNIGLKKDRKF
jgi:hypothetical protein